MRKESVSMQAKPRLCVVSTTPLVIHFFIRPHMLALARHYDVTLVLNQNNDSYTAPLDLPITIHSVDMMREIAPKQDLRCLWQLYRLFRRQRYDQIWAVVPKAGLLSMVAGVLAGIKSRVFVFQGEVWMTRSGPMRWILKAVDWLTARCSTHVLAVSHSEQALLEQHGIVPPGRVNVLGAGSICGVSLERFRPDAAIRAAIRRDLNIPHDAVVALSLGRLKREKGVVELAQAFVQANPQTPLYLVYVGPDEGGISDQIRQAIAPVAERVRLVGYTARPEDYMAAADFVCLPSYREGLGMVVLEAAAVGIPAIGSRVSGISDAIAEDETGLMFPVRDVTALTHCLERITDDASLRRQLGQAARQRVASQFEQGAVVQAYVDYLLAALLESGIMLG